VGVLNQCPMKLGTPEGEEVGTCWKEKKPIGVAVWSWGEGFKSIGRACRPRDRESKYVEKNEVRKKGKIRHSIGGDRGKILVLRDIKRHTHFKKDRGGVVTERKSKKHKTWQGGDNGHKELRNYYRGEG